MPTISAWRLRDTLAATALFFATAAFTLWQNTQVAVLWDIDYLLDSSWRISLGQIPYRDFPFAHAPLTFLLHAAIIRLFGRVYFPHLACSALEAGAATLLTWRILIRLLSSATQEIGSGEGAMKVRVAVFEPDRARTLALLLAAPLAVVGIYGIYPHPVYDSDTILAVLLALYLLQRATTGPGSNLLTGAACVVPVFFKQNVGLPFLFAAMAAVAAAAIPRLRQRLSIAPQLWLLLGAAAALAAALLTLHATAGVHNYLYWTITFARQRRLPGISEMLSTYNQVWLLWTLPAAAAALLLLRLSKRWARAVAILLLAAPFLWTMISLALADDASDRADQLLSLWPHLLLLGAALAVWGLIRTRPNFSTLLPVVLLITIHGAFLSQQLWGSTYALWPLLMLLVAALLTQIPAIARPLAVVIATTFFLCGGLYAISHERLSYVHLDGPIARASQPELQGLATPGPWIPAFEEMVRVTNTEIPASDGILLIPGEEPFYFATGRTPQFPVLLCDPATDPYTPEQTRDEARARNIRWLVMKTNTQLMAPPYDELPEITRALLQDFAPYRTLTNYTIYRRKGPSAIK